MKEIREPKQERSNEKKSRIIESAYELFAEVGYYRANTPDIAKKAGVSTGIIYSYFKDKHDILLYVLKIYVDKVAEPLVSELKKIQKKEDINTAIPKILNSVIKIHKDNKELHTTLHSIAPTDDEVNGVFISLEDKITEDISAKLTSVGIETENLKEKVHIGMNEIQFFAHEYIYDKHSYIDYDEMKKIVVKMIVSLFN